MTPKHQHTAGKEKAAEIFRWFNNRFGTEIEFFTVEDQEQLNTIIDKHTARLIVPEPSDEDKQLIAGLEAHTKADKYAAKAKLRHEVEAEVVAMEIENQYAAWRQESQQGDTTFLDTRLRIVEAMIIKHTAANCDHLIAMNKGLNVLNDKLQAEKAALVEAIESIEYYASEAVNVISGEWHGVIGDKLCAIVTHIRNQASTAIANATEKQKEPHSETLLTNINAELLKVAEELLRYSERWVHTHAELVAYISAKSHVRALIAKYENKTEEVSSETSTG